MHVKLISATMIGKVACQHENVYDHDDADNELVVMVYWFIIWLALVHPICLPQSTPMHLHLPCPRLNLSA